MPTIDLATVLHGAESFSDNNINSTFRGQVLTKDGKTRQAIIKDLNLVQLCNELVANYLAREVGLPVPDCYLGLADPDVLTLEEAPETEDGSRLVFVSVDVKVPNITYQWNGTNQQGRKALLDQILKWGNLGHLYAFDTWVANIDRHAGNLLFGGKNEFWLIDHGHCFTGPDWKADELDPHMEYDNRLSEWLTSCLSDKQKEQRVTEVCQFGEDIKDFEPNEAMENSYASQLLPLQNVNALKGFLEERKAIVPVHASNALDTPRLM